MEPLPPPLTPASLDELRQRAIIQELEFRSGIPVAGRLIAGFRRLWNSISTRWYVQDAVRQQVSYNLELVGTLDHMVRYNQALANLAGEQARRLEQLVVDLGHLESRVRQSEIRLDQIEGGLTDRVRQSEIRLDQIEGGLTDRVRQSEIRLDQIEGELIDGISQRMEDCENRHENARARLGKVLAEYIAENAREAAELAIELNRIRELCDKPVQQP